MLVKTPQNVLWIPKKLAKNGDFRKILDPIWDFSTKEGFKIRDPRISWYPLGTKNHEMWGPPVLLLQAEQFYKNGPKQVCVKIPTWYLYIMFSIIMYVLYLAKQEM